MGLIQGVAGHKSIKTVLEPSVRSLCSRPYHGHPKGCPNYGKLPGCTPAAQMIDKIFDLTKPVWAIYVEYNLDAHRKRMWQKHPNWSKRQVECCLYWQRKVMSFLENRVANFCTMNILYGEQEELISLYRPEAHGVNVTKTMADAGIELQWPPETIVYKIAFVGKALNSSHREVGE